MVVGISVKETLLGAVPVCIVKDVMGSPASLKRMNVSVTRHVVLWNHKLETELYICFLSSTFVNNFNYIVLLNL